MDECPESEVKSAAKDPDVVSFRVPLFIAKVQALLSAKPFQPLLSAHTSRTLRFVTKNDLLLRR